MWPKLCSAAGFYPFREALILSGCIQNLCIGEQCLLLAILAKVPSKRVVELPETAAALERFQTVCKKSAVRFLKCPGLLGLPGRMLRLPGKDFGFAGPAG